MDVETVGIHNPPVASDGHLMYYLLQHCPKVHFNYRRYVLPTKLRTPKLSFTCHARNGLEVSVY